MFKYVNLEKFEEFLKENVKYNVYDLDAYLYELWEQYCNNGIEEYELNKNETKNGQTMTISYNIINKLDNEDNIVKTIIEF